jgi:hypothetical protein
MNEEYPNYIYVWDLDRADSLFHARAVLAQVAGKAYRSHVRTRESGARFIVLDCWQSAPRELTLTHFSNIETLATALRNTFLETNSQVEGGLNMFVAGLPDTVGMIEGLLAQQQGLVDVLFQPQPDRSTLG